MSPRPRSPRPPGRLAPPSAVGLIPWIAERAREVVGEIGLRPACGDYIELASTIDEVVGTARVTAQALVGADSARALVVRALFEADAAAVAALVEARRFEALGPLLGRSDHA